MTTRMAALGGLYLALVLVLAACNSGPKEARPTPTPSPVVALPSPTPEPTASPTPTPDATATPAVTPSPAPTPTTAPTPATVPTGSPFSFADFETAWQARDMTVTLGTSNVSFAGFATPAFDARLARGSDSLELSILVYADRQAIGEDWELTVGESPVAREGRVVPDHISMWWNENVAVVVRTRVGDIASEALDAFLSLGETPAGEARARQLAYVGADGAIWLVNADGSGQSKLADAGTCSARHFSLVWSPTGQRIVCLSHDALRPGLVVLIDTEKKTATEIEFSGHVRIAWAPSGRFLLYAVSEGAPQDSLSRLFVGDDRGQLLADLGISYWLPWLSTDDLWSPDGHYFAYWSRDAAELRIHSVETGEERRMGGDYRPLAWALAGRTLIVADKHRSPPPQQLAYPTYEANLLDVTSGQLTRVPQLDNGSQFWLSPDGEGAAVVVFPNVAILELLTRRFAVIQGSSIHYPSESIMLSQVAFTPDGSYVYWQDIDSPATIYRAKSDGTDLTKVAALDRIFIVGFSPDVTQIVYMLDKADGQPGKIFVANIDGSGARFLGEGLGPVAWSPIP